MKSRFSIYANLANRTSRSSVIAFGALVCSNWFINFIAWVSLSDSLDRLNLVSAASFLMALIVYRMNDSFISNSLSP